MPLRASRTRRAVGRGTLTDHANLAEHRVKQRSREIDDPIGALIDTITSCASPPRKTAPRHDSARRCVPSVARNSCSGSAARREAFVRRGNRRA